MLAVGQIDLSTSISLHNIDIWATITIGHERDARPVWRPGGPGVIASADRQTGLLAAVGIHHTDPRVGVAGRVS